MATRESMLDEINEARRNHDAKEIVRLIQSSNINLLTKDDISLSLCQHLRRVANDKFSQDLYALKA